MTDESYQDRMAREVEEKKRTARRCLRWSAAVLAIGLLGFAASTGLWASGDRSGIVEWLMWWTGSISLASAICAIGATSMMAGW